MLTIEQQNLVAANIGLAHFIANKMKHQYPDEDERISAAYTSLVRAAMKYDPTRNIMFTTYAAACIVKSMSKEYFRGGVFNITRSMLKSQYYSKFTEMQRDFREELNNFPSLKVEKKEEAPVIPINLSCLTERERFVIEQNFYKNIKQSHLAKPLRLTKERVRQIRKKALVKIKESNPHLETYLKDYNVLRNYEEN